MNANKLFAAVICVMTIVFAGTLAHYTAKQVAVDDAYIEVRCVEVRASGGILNAKVTEICAEVGVDVRIVESEIVEPPEDFYADPQQYPFINWMYSRLHFSRQGNVCMGYNMFYEASKEVDLVIAELELCLDDR